MANQDGVAKIKPEFLDPDHKPKLAAEYLPESTKAELEATINDTSDNGPPAKKKFKGRNKQRPRQKRLGDHLRICKSIFGDKVCVYGDKCKFSHDLQEYLKSKPKDLGEKCYNYDTFGYCPYGLACRFSSSHMSDDNKNIKKDDIFNEERNNALTCNFLTKELQIKLRKREYDFSKSNEVLQQRLKTSCIVPEELLKNQDAGENKSLSTTGTPSNEPQPCKSEQLTTAEGPVETCETIPQNPLDKNTTDRQADITHAKCESDAHANIVDGHSTEIRTLGAVTDEDVITLRPQEKKRVDFSNKLYLAPLTTVGNLPFRRICKEYGVDITCGEMAMCSNLLQGQQSEWALLRRHHTEDLFGVQVCGGYPDTMTRCAQLICETTKVDFIDINVGCPIDLVFRRGEGSALMGRAGKFNSIIESMQDVIDVPLTVKMRTGIYADKYIAHKLLPNLRDWGVDMCTVHGRTREQRYTKLADWDYIDQCAKVATPMTFFGNGDILSYEDAQLRKDSTGVSGVMVARGALIKPWLFTEIKEQRHWDISSGERLEMLRRYTNYGLEHWGSDQQGVDNTRRFLLEWLSFLHRYIPVGVLERVPQRINERPPYYVGRDDLETLMASENCSDWVKISEMLLGPVPDGFIFLPKHKANSYK